MATNLRISLAILSLGFGVEGAGEAYSLLTTGAFLPGSSLLLFLPSVITVLGMLFLLVGRHEWGELHRSHVRRSNTIFLLSLLGGFVAAIEVAVLALIPGIGVPVWAEVLFGAAVGSLVLGTFVTYAHLVFHLVTRLSQAALVASALWAVVVTIFIANALASDLPTILGLISARTFSADSLITPVDHLASFFFLSYFLLLAGYLDAHLTVARGSPTTNVALSTPAPDPPMETPTASGGSKRR